MEEKSAWVEIYASAYGGRREDMISGYKFKEIEKLNCFEDETNSIFHFPITDSEEFPREIREKTEEIIESIVHAHKLDLSKLRLCARIILYSDRTGNWSNEISIVISDCSTFDGTWIEENYNIGHDDPLYEPFKAYIMKQLEEILFRV